MKAKIGTSFGLALLLAIGVIATMLALGMLTPGKASAAHAGIVIADGTLANVPTTPGETATYTMHFRNHEALTANSGQIYVKFTYTIGVPATIEKERITISASAGGVSNPVFDPEITSDTSGNPVVILTVGDTEDATGTQDLDAYAEPVSTAGQTTNTNSGHILQFSRLAGITNSTTPSTEDTTGVSMSVDGVTYGTQRTFSVLRWLQLSSTSGAAGKVITLTGKAYSSGGSANVWLDENSDGLIGTSETVLGTSDANISAGAFTASFTVGGSFLVGKNSLNAVDSTGVSPTTPYVSATPRLGAQAFTKRGSVSASVTSASRGETITITLDDFGGASTADGIVNTVTFGLAAADLSGITSTAIYTDSDGSFDVAIPSTTQLGTQTISVTSTATSGDAESARTTTITVIGGFTIAVSPATAVANQTVTVSGTGFVGSGTVTADTITVGGVTADHDAVTIDNSGNLITTFSIPAGGGDATGNDETGVLRAEGSHEIKVVDSAGRIGIVNVTVPDRVITIDPTDSRRGSTVGVVGSGFPASTTVTITHGSTTVATVTADSAGNLPTGTTFTVPSSAGIPSTNTVTATIGDPTSAQSTVERTATATHKVPGASVTTDPASAASGGTVTLTGLDFPGFVSLSVLTIGGISALPTPAPATDSSGNFTASVLVPALSTGTQTLLATAGGISANVPITITAAATTPTVTTSATETTFADEITADNLVRVWWFSNENQAWSFFDPRPAFSAANTYGSASTGDIVWVNVTAQTTFQSATLFPGWNLISLD